MVYAYERVIYIFTKMRDFNRKLGNVYKARAYQNAIDILGNKNGLGKMGQSLKKKVRLITKQGTIDEYEQLLKYEQLIAIKGFGPSFINKMIKMSPPIDFSTPKDLLENDRVGLTRHQKIGILYQEELAQRIPRSLVKKMGNQLKLLIKRTGPNATEK